MAAAAELYNRDWRWKQVCLRIVLSILTMLQVSQRGASMDHQSAWNGSKWKDNKLRTRHLLLLRCQLVAEGDGLFYLILYNSFHCRCPKNSTWTTTNLRNDHLCHHPCKQGHHQELRALEVRIPITLDHWVEVRGPWGGRLRAVLEACKLWDHPTPDYSEGGGVWRGGIEDNLDHPSWSVTCCYSTNYRPPTASRLDNDDQQVKTE